MSDKTVVYSEAAVETIERMYEHVEVLERGYGDTSEEYLKAAASLLRVMGKVVWRGADNVQVHRDGDLSLFVSEGSFVYGIVWHAVRRHCEVEGCKAYLNDDGTAWTYSRDHHVCDEGMAHVPSYPYEAPHPGEWSTHS